MSPQILQIKSNWFADQVLLVGFGRYFTLQTPPHNDIGFTLSYCAPEVYFDRQS
ncbi:hypothetical protein V1507DRAFT_448041 [Lipomyces tetrasporus]